MDTTKGFYFQEKNIGPDQKKQIKPKQKIIYIHWETRNLSVIEIQEAEATAVLQSVHLHTCPS